MGFLSDTGLARVWAKMKAYVASYAVKSGNGIKAARQLTQAEYDALTYAQKMDGTMYYISDSDSTIPPATETAAGLLSAADKKKLNGIEAGARVNVQANWNETNAASDAYIKNKPSSLPANGGTAQTISEILPISKGGTGKTTGEDAANTLINSLSIGDSTIAPKDGDYFISQFVGGGTTNTRYLRRGVLSLWLYVKSKLPDSAISGSYSDLTNKPNLTPEGIGAFALHQNNGFITDEYRKKFRTQAKGDAEYGPFLSTIRTSRTGIEGMPIYSAALAFGVGDANAFLCAQYNSASAFIGGGGADGISWVKELAFLDSNVTSATEAEKAKKVIDSGRSNHEITFSYYKEGIDNPEWLAAWNGYELRAISVNSVKKLLGVPESAIKYRELTQAEYNALPGTKNSDGVIYFIKDAG